MEFRQASDWGRLSRTKVGKAMDSDFGRTTLENRKSVYPRRSMLPGCLQWHGSGRDESELLSEFWRVRLRTEEATKGAPHGGIMCLGVSAREGRRQAAEEMLRSGRAAIGEQEPGALQIREERELLEQPLFFPKARVAAGRHVLSRPKGDAKDCDALLIQRPIADPEVRAKVVQMRRGYTASTVPNAHFGTVGRDTAMAGADVIQIGKQAFPGTRLLAASDKARCWPRG